MVRSIVRRGLLALLLVMMVGCATSPAPAAGGGSGAAVAVPVNVPADVPAPWPVALAVSSGTGWVAAGVDGLTLVGPSGDLLQVDAGGRVRDLFWSPQGEWLLVGLDGGHVLLVRPADLAEARSLREKAVDVSTQLAGLPHTRLLVAWSPDGHSALVTADWAAVPTGSVATPIWQVTPATGELRKVAEVGRVVGLHFLPGGQALVQQGAGCCGFGMQRLNLATGEMVSLGAANSLVAAPNGAYYAHSPYQGSTVTAVDVVAGRSLVSGRDWPSGLTPNNTDAPVYQTGLLSWSPDGHVLAYTRTRIRDNEPQTDETTLNTVDFSWEQQPKGVDGWLPGLAWVGDGHDMVYATRTGRGLQTYLNGTVLGQYDGALGLGLGNLGSGVARSGDGRYLAYVLERANHESMLVLADLRAGTVQEWPSASGLVPLTWTADNRLVAARASAPRAVAPGEVVGWEVQSLAVMPVPGAIGGGPGAAVGGDAAVPFWGPPGTRVTVSGARVLSQSYAPLQYEGRTLQGVRIEDGTYFFRQEGDAVWLDGYTSNTGTLELLPKPRLLYRLPLTIGATFTLADQNHVGITVVERRVIGFETIDTPAGRFATVVVQRGSREREWWAPVLGPVKETLMKEGEVATTQVEQGPAEPLPMAARLDAQTIGYLVGLLEVRDQQGQLLLEMPATSAYDRARWQDIGAAAPLLLLDNDSKGEPHDTQRGYVWDAAAHRFAPLRWRLPDGREKTRLFGRWEAPGSPVLTRLLDEERYPMAWCRFHWDGERMACDAWEGGGLPRTEQEMARALTALYDAEGWARMFQDPDLGRQAWLETRRADGGNVLSYMQPQQQADGSWIVRGQKSFRFTLVRQDGQWRVASWAPGP